MGLLKNDRAFFAVPVGPCGQGGYALIELGRAAVTLFPALIAKYPDRAGFAELQGVGVAMYGSGVLAGLLLWGLGIWWLFIAVASVSSQLFTKGLIRSFNMGWSVASFRSSVKYLVSRAHAPCPSSSFALPRRWAFTFPLGSLALLTFSLGTSFDSSFFTNVAAAFGWVVFALWCVVAGPTLRGFLRGTLFPAPCLASLPPEYVEKVHPIGRAGREEARVRARGMAAAGGEPVRGEAEAEDKGTPTPTPITTPRSRSPGLSKVEVADGVGRQRNKMEGEASAVEPESEAQAQVEGRKPVADEGIGAGAEALLTEPDR